MNKAPEEILTVTFSQPGQGYVKDVRMVLSEKLERETRDPDNKYWLVQWDETDMRK